MNATTGSASSTGAHPHPRPVVAPKVRVNHITAGQVHTDRTAEHYDQVGQDGAEVVGRPLAGYASRADLGVEGGGELPARFLATLPD